MQATPKLETAKGGRVASNDQLDLEQSLYELCKKKEFYARRKLQKLEVLRDKTSNPIKLEVLIFSNTNALKSWQEMWLIHTPRPINVV